MQTKEEKRAQDKRYYEKNSEVISEKRKKEYVENKEEHRSKDEKYRNANRETIKKRQRKWYEDNVDRVKGNKLKYSYGITLEEYQAMFNAQEGKCLICNRHQDELKQALYVDHDHVTEKIRGLLCHKCNTVLGYADDDIQVLINAIEYLKKYKSL
jgi:hypothetical protein